MDSDPRSPKVQEVLVSDEGLLRVSIQCGRVATFPRQMQMAPLLKGAQLRRPTFQPIAKLIVT